MFGEKDYSANDFLPEELQQGSARPQSTKVPIKRDNIHDLKALL